MKTKHIDMTSAILAMTGASILGETPVNGSITAMNSTQDYGRALAQDVAGYLAGLPSTDEESLLDLLCPPIEGAPFFQYAKADDEAFLTEADGSDIRATGATFKRIEYKGTTVTDATQQKGLTIRVDHRTLPMVNGKRRDGWENRFAAALKARLVRAELIRFLSLLDAAASNVAKVWSAATNPDGDLRGIAQLTRTATGMKPTHILMGSAAQQLRQDAYEAAARANHAMANHAGYTMEELARYAGAGNVIIEDGVTQVKKGAAKTDRLGLAVYSYSAEPGVILDDPSNFKRVWNPTEYSGSKWAVAIQPSTVYTDITVFHESKIIAPILSGIRKLTVSAA
jgi:hypothetical protein